MLNVAQSRRNDLTDFFEIWHTGSTNVFICIYIFMQYKYISPSNRTANTNK